MEDEIYISDALGLISRALTIVIFVLFITLGIRYFSGRFIEVGNQIIAKPLDVLSSFDAYQIPVLIVITGLGKLFQAIFFSSKSWLIRRGQLEIETEMWFGSRKIFISKYDLEKAEIKAVSEFKFLSRWRIQIKTQSGEKFLSPNFVSEEAAITALALFEY